jgi:hypothetical protein
MWWRATVRSGMKIYVFIAWEYNVLKVGPRWSLKIVNKYFLLPKSTRFL